MSRSTILKCQLVFCEVGQVFLAQETNTKWQIVCVANSVNAIEPNSSITNDY